MDVTEKHKVLKNYLGVFYGQILPKEDQELFDSYGVDKEQAIYFEHSNFVEAMKFGLYFLLKNGYVNYRMVLAYDLINLFLDKEDSENKPNSFDGFNEDLLIIYHPKHTVKNKRTVELILHTVQKRILLKKRVLVLVENTLSELKTNFPGIIIDKDERVKKDRNFVYEKRKEETKSETPIINI